MSVVSIVIIVFAILLVIGNLSMIRATPFENWVGGFRTKAKKQGFSVRLVAQPEWVRTNSEKSQGSRKGMIASYTLEFVGDEFDLLQAKVVDNSLWVVAGERVIQGMGCELAGVKAVELVGQAATIYWNEVRMEGLTDEQSIDLLKGYLQKVVKER